ncbi:MAG: CbtA family protein [Actinomycetota bacterium]|nr:CbtA family protein [Actinomycetota bacterium]
MITPYLRRGMAAGLLAGLLAGLFAFFTGEPLLDQAIGLEESAVHSHEEGAAHSHDEEVFGRATQKVGLFFATGLSGVFIGGLFGLTYAYFRGRMAARSEWGRSVSLAAAIFAGAVLIPFIKYPANPPTVGDPATIGTRTAAYLALVGLSLLAILAAWHVSRLLRERGVVSTPVRQVTIGLGLIIVVTGLFVGLPAAADPGEFPAGLLWSFRLSSLGTQTVLWASLGALFGLLGERAEARKTHGAPAASLAESGSP